MDRRSQAVAAALASPLAARPHHHSPLTIGEVAAEILRRHRLGDRATDREAVTLVEAIAAGPGAANQPYRIAGVIGGMVGAPGTWISTGSGSEPIYHLSPYVRDVYPREDPPADPTATARAVEALTPLVLDLLGRPDDMDLRYEGRVGFSGEDAFSFVSPASPSGRDTFHVHLSHIAKPYAPGIQGALKRAAEQIALQQRHPDEIRRHLEMIRHRVERRFSRFGLPIGETRLLTATGDAQGVTRVDAVTEVTVLGHAYERTGVLLTMSEPPEVAPGMADGFRIHGRDLKRRTEALAGRQPTDALVACPVVARECATLEADEARTRRAAYMSAATGREGVATGPQFRHGRLTDTVRIGSKVTFRNRTLLVQDGALPDSVLPSLKGRLLQDVCDDARLDGLVVDHARNDSKGRLSVIVEQPDAIPFQTLLDMLAQRSEQP